MSLILGGMLGLGVLLVLSPWLWPARPTEGSKPPPFESARDSLSLAGLGGVSLPVVVVVCLLLAAVTTLEILGVISAPHA